MAQLKYKEQIDLLATLESFKIDETMRFKNSQVKKTTLRALCYQWRSDGILKGSFTVISIPKSDEYIVTRTA